MVGEEGKSMGGRERMEWGGGEKGRWMTNRRRE